MSVDFWETPIGRKFFGLQVPELIRKLDGIADELSKINATLKELKGEEAPNEKPMDSNTD